MKPYMEKQQNTKRQKLISLLIKKEEEISKTIIILRHMRKEITIQRLFLSFVFIVSHSPYNKNLKFIIVI